MYCRLQHADYRGRIWRGQFLNCRHGPLAGRVLAGTEALTGCSITRYAAEDKDVAWCFFTCNP
jgi:hypothetical protein